jgi:hypothetical protein
MAKTKEELARADAALFHKRQRDADKPIAAEDYRAEQAKALKNMAKLRKERLEREAAAPPPEPKKSRKQAAKTGLRRARSGS